MNEKKKFDVSLRKYILDQSKDAPYFDTMNFYDGYGLNDMKHTEENDYNLFDFTTAGSKVTGQILDDDGIKTVRYWLYTTDKANPTSPEDYTIVTSLSGKEYKGEFDNINKSPYNLSIQLPNKEGKYRLHIEATDTKGETGEGISINKVIADTMIAIDENLPKVSLNYESGSLVTVAPDLEITLEDTAGIKKIERYAEIPNQEDSSTIIWKDTPEVVKSATIDSIAGNAIAAEKFTIMSYNFDKPTDDVNKLKLKGKINASETGRKLYKVYDTYGRVNEFKFEWKIDKLPPEFTVVQATNGVGFEDVPSIRDDDRNLIESGNKSFSDFTASDVRVFNQGNMFEITGTLIDLNSGNSNWTYQQRHDYAQTGNGNADASMIDNMFYKAIRKGSDGKYYTSVKTENNGTVTWNENPTELPEVNASGAYAEIAQYGKDNTAVLFADGWVDTSKTVSITRTGAATNFIDEPNWRASIDASGFVEGEDYIVYLAAIAGINQELYEAASVDGAGRFSKMWHITLPGIRPTIVVLLIMNLGNILGSSFDRPFAFQNNTVMSVANVISTFAIASETT